MVLPSLSIGAAVGVILSAGFVYVEVGRYATPQVPVTLFEERREIFGYTAGLFVGIPFAVVYILYVLAMDNGALPGALLFLAILVGGTELAQWAVLRSRVLGSRQQRTVLCARVPGRDRRDHLARDRRRILGRSLAPVGWSRAGRPPVVGTRGA